MKLNEAFDTENITIEDRKTGKEEQKDINSTGGKEENQLPELLKAYREHRNKNNLWEIKNAK